MTETTKLILACETLRAILDITKAPRNADYEYDSTPLDGERLDEIRGLINRCAEDLAL